MQSHRKRIALSINLPKNRRSGSFRVACVLGNDLAINDFEVDLLDAILSESANDNQLPNAALTLQNVTPTGSSEIAPW